MKRKKYRKHFPATHLSCLFLAGIEHIVLAMPHRGRLNFLTEPTLMKYSPTSLFHKIKGGSEIPEEIDAVGDVISHLGTSESPDCSNTFC